MTSGATFSCCKAHDMCYKGLNDGGTCRRWLGQVYLLSYEYECAGASNGTGVPKCLKAETECARATCECDVAFAKCIQQHKVTEKKECPATRYSCFG